MYECRHCILYPLRLEPPFPNDDSTLKPKVGLGPNFVKIDSRKVFMENITYFWKNKIISGKERSLKTRMHTHTQSMCMLMACAPMHEHAYEARVLETI